MEDCRRIISGIADLLAQDDQYVTDYLQKRKIDYRGFKEKMLKELGRRKGECRTKEKGAEGSA